MTEEEKKRIINPNYPDFIIDPSDDIAAFSKMSDTTINFIDGNNAVLHTNTSNADKSFIGTGFSNVPRLFGLLDTSNLEDMGVQKVQNVPALSLSGKGVLIGIIDTGIDYTNPVFKNSDNSTRIISIWDQTIENLQATDDIFYYGTQYTKNDINLALQNENPFSIVPTTDTIGHGTALAALAAGSPMENKDFSGVATQAEYVIVKLKPAKSILKWMFEITEESICYQENDIMFGIKYLDLISSYLQRPIAICIALGSNQGSHDGQGKLESMLSEIALSKGKAIIVAAGNEGNEGHHYYGFIDKTIGYDTVELKVGEKEQGFIMEIWSYKPDIFTIDITSPSGEYVDRIPARMNQNQAIDFIFENSKVIVHYYMVDPKSGEQLILINLQNPTAGIWHFRIYGDENTTAGFHIWLPLDGFIKKDTFFLRSNPDTTITSPGNANSPITVTSYDHIHQSIYIKSSRGYTRYNLVKPELAAPGVNLLIPKPNNRYGSGSGSSLAAAEATGIAALLLEWGIIKGNDGVMNTLGIKNYLLRGTKKKSNTIYPNKEWGYGMIDIYETFLKLRGS